MEAPKFTEFEIKALFVLAFLGLVFCVFGAVALILFLATHLRWA